MKNETNSVRYKRENAILKTKSSLSGKIQTTKK